MIDFLDSTPSGVRVQVDHQKTAFIAGERLTDRFIYYTSQLRTFDDREPIDAATKKRIIAALVERFPGVTLE